MSYVEVEMFMRGYCGGAALCAFDIAFCGANCGANGYMERE